MKTIEEAAKVMYDDAKSIGAFINGAEYAQRWISINEELPSLREYCLVKLSDGTAMYAQFTYFGWNIFWAGGTSGQSSERPVTHWRKIEIE